MPYSCKQDGRKWYLRKIGSEDVIGSHDTKRDCIQQMRAIYAEELSSPKNVIINDYNVAPYDLDQKIKDSGDEIHVVINGQGGDFFEAISTHQKLRNSGKKVIAHINPLAFSAHAVVALAADIIFMPENGLMMFHLPKVIPQGAKSADDLEKLTSGLRASEEVLVNILVSKTKKSKEDCESIIRNDTWMTAEEAKNAGIVDEIVPIFRDIQIGNFFPERIVNFLKEKTDMPLKDLLDQFNVKDEAELVSMISVLQKNQIPKPVDPGEGVINMVKQARETMLQSLLDSGKVIPPVLNELKLEFTTPERIKLDMTTNNTKEFDRIINSYSKNEPVISFKGKTGAQNPPGGDGGGDDKDDDVCARLMKVEADKAKA